MPESSEPIEILGVVQPPGPGGGNVGKEELWSLIFFVEPWKRADGSLDSRRLRLEQPGFTHGQLRQGMATIKPYTVVRARVKFFKPRPNMLFSAQVTEILTLNDPDPELTARATEMQKPVVVAHPVFGPLTLDRRIRSFKASLTLAGQEIEISIGAVNDAPHPEFVAVAERFWKNQADWDHRLREFAAAQLIELKNDTSLQEDEEPITEAQFIERLTPNSMTFDPPDEFTIYYDDGDIFWGHGIEIRGTLTKGPQSAHLVG